MSSTYALESGEPLAHIVGLPKEDGEASLAESKFQRAVEGLRRVYPKITEARATVKVTELPKERKRYEVHVFVELPGHRVDFVEEGWSLAETFDGVARKLKNLKTKPEKNPTYRRHPTRAEFESATM
jgi:ribosome-associated translation inhibitor RaiA